MTAGQNDGFYEPVNVPRKVDLLTAGSLPLLRFESSGRPGKVSQDASQITRLRTPRGDRPGLTRLVVIDGVTQAKAPDDDPEFHFVTPDVETARGIVEGPVWVNNLLLRELRRNPSVVDAVDRVHRAVQLRFGHLKPREIPQSAVGVVQLWDFADGRIVGEAWRAADTEVWTHDSRSWNRLFDEHIWSPEMRQTQELLVARAQHQLDLGVIDKAEFKRRQRFFDRILKDEHDTWIASDTVGRYPGLPNLEYEILPENWTRLLVATDGFRLNQSTVGNWPNLMRTGPQPDEREIKAIDDCTLLVVSRQEFEQWILSTVGFECDSPALS